MEYKIRIPAKTTYKLDNALSALVFAFVMVLLLSISIANVLRGPSSADDAWIALTAKNVATGKGYATALSDSKLIQFDPFISTGPPLVFPTALAIHIFGNSNGVPGAVQLGVFVMQIALVTLLFVKRVAWSPALFFVSALMVLLMLMVSKNWYFGALLGEPVAFGFILLGLAFLATFKERWSTVTAALCFSLAILTKQISLFSVAGVILAWFLISIYDGLDNRNLIKDCFAIILGVLSLPILFEVFRLFNVGFEGYVRFIQSTFNAAVSDESSYRLFERLASFSDTLFQSYLRSVLVAIVILVSVLCLILFINRDGSIARRVAALAGGGAIMHFAYIALISKIWPRYLWIGIAIALVAISSALLSASPKQRYAFLSLLILILVFGGGKPIFPRQFSRDTIAIEREKVVSILDDDKEIPYAAEYWSSIYDVVYLRKDEGVWRFGQGIRDLYGVKFIAVINNKFTDKNSNFFRSVDATCKSIMRSPHYGVFNCGQSFWIDYKG